MNQQSFQVSLRSEETRNPEPGHLTLLGTRYLDKLRLGTGTERQNSTGGDDSLTRAL